MNLTPTPKKSPKGPKEVQKRPQMWPELKHKVMAVLPKPKLIVYIGRSQKVFEPDPSPKNSPEESKKYKKGLEFGRITKKITTP